MKFIPASLLILTFQFAFAQTPADCGRKLPDSLTYEILRQRIELCRVRTIEDLLSVFPDSYLSNYTLMNDARGRQQASNNAPRATLFGRDASLMVAFNGDPSQRAFEDLEIIQFRRDSKNFEFRRITFPEGAAASIPAPVFSNANPMECVMCHRRDNPRPNWDGALLWPGAFGAEDDFIFRPNGSTNNVEGQRYREFFRTGKNQGRYRFLTPAHGTDSVLPNTLLGIKMGALNMQNIARSLAMDSRVRPFRFALLGAVSCGGAFPADSFLPPAVLAKAQHPLSWLVQDTMSFNNESFKMRMMRLRSLNSASPESPRIAAANADAEAGRAVYGLPEVTAIAGLRLIAEEILGLPVRFWSMELASRHYVFADGLDGITALRGPLVDEFFKTDGRLRAARALSPADCETLRRQSLAELAPKN